MGCEENMSLHSLTVGQKWPFLDLAAVNVLTLNEGLVEAFGKVFSPLRERLNFSGEYIINCGSQKAKTRNHCLI